MKVDYSKTFIYKLCCRDPTITYIYVGHSTDFKSRNQKHKNSCNNINSKEYKYRFIRENGSYDNWIMIKLYDFPCNSKREAEAEETKTMIELGATLNSMKSFVSEEDRKEYVKEYNKEYREKNKPELVEKKKIYDKEYRKNNKTEISKQNKVRYENNKTEILEKKKVKIKCEFCGCELQKHNLSKHQKTLKCKKFQGFVDVE